MSFMRMNNFYTQSFVSHKIEGRLAQRIAEKTGETIDPLAIPELVDQKIREAIKEYHELHQPNQIYGKFIT